MTRAVLAERWWVREEKIGRSDSDIRVCVTPPVRLDPYRRCMLRGSGHPKGQRWASWPASGRNSGELTCWSNGMSNEQSDMTRSAELSPHTQQ